MADAERMARFLDLTASFAHQLNNDLATVLGYAEMLSDGNAGDVVNAWAMEIFAAGTRLRSTVERFRMLHGIASAELHLFDICQLIARNRNALLSRLDPSLTLSIDVSQFPLTIKGNPKDLEAILRQVCHTAVGNIPRGGHLYLATAAITTSSPQPLSHGILPEGQYVQITVLASTKTMIATDIKSAEYATIDDTIRPGRISGDFVDLRCITYLLHGFVHTHGQKNLYRQTEIYLPLAQ